MANPQLTVKQFAVLSLGQATPPWHLGGLLKTYNRYSISLRQSISALSAAKAVIYVQIGDFNYMLARFFDNYHTNYTPNNAVWTSMLEQALSPDYYEAAPYPDYPDYPRNVLLSLSNILSPVGGSIVYLGQNWSNWNTVGISGTFGALANLNVAIVPAAIPSNFPSAFGGFEYLRQDPNQNILLAPITWEAGGTVVLSSTSDTPLSRAKVGNVPLGLLWVYFGNKKNTMPKAVDIDILQLFAQLLQITRETMISLLFTILPSVETIAGASKALSNYIAWLNYLTTLTAVNFSALPSGTLSLEFDGQFIVPEITLQPSDTSLRPITISEYTLQPDGTSTGGKVSQ